ncbi:MAG: hypothetical protein GX608_09020 [Lentisphaerae bacterium]|nr:hypothetical protein [Lentisphaerota bacterium]
MSETTDPRLTRAHIIHAARSAQIGLNLLALAGGRPYIEARLARLPFESNASWNGRTEVGASQSRFGPAAFGSAPGRMDRAFLINYASRIVRKINQYVFATEVQRQGADPAFLADATRAGMPLNALMVRASEILTTARWCWISVDRDAAPRDARGNPVRRSVADKEASGDRVYWSVWAPHEVVDWHINRNGRLIWVITEQSVFDNADVARPAVNRLLRTIWKRGGGVRLWLDPEDKEKILLEEPFTSTLDEVGFVLVGTPSAEPWWFDDVEAAQAALLNLHSVHTENLFQAVYPQLVLPDGMLQTVMDALKISGEAVMELIRGLNYPIFEPLDAAGQSRYLTPSASDLKAIPDEIMRLRGELFETVGLAMQQAQLSRQVASAASKAWDHLDPEAVLKERALLLEEGESKAVALSRRLDSTFAVYKPVYGQSFSVRDLSEEMGTLLDMNKLDLPAAARKEIQRAGVAVLDRFSGIAADRKQAILAAIDGGNNAPAT